MRNVKRVLIGLTFLFAGKTLAYEAREGNVTAMLGPTLGKTDFQGSASGATSPLLGGLGLIVLGDVNPRGSLEVAMLFANKSYARESAGLYMVEQTQNVHITMGYRWWLGRIFSTSLSFFSGNSIGDSQVVHSDFPPGQDIDTSARDIIEYGVDWSVQTELWHKDKMAVVLDTRYSLSLTPKENEKANHFGVMLGFRYLVQEKEEKKP